MVLRKLQTAGRNDEGREQHPMSGEEQEPSSAVSHYIIPLREAEQRCCAVTILGLMVAERETGVLCGYHGVTTSRLPLPGNKSCPACAIWKCQLSCSSSGSLGWCWSVASTGCGDCPQELPHICRMCPERDASTTIQFSGRLTSAH